MQEQALTEGQVSFFHTFGYHVFRNLFSPDELAEIRREFDESMADQYSHRPYDGSERHWTVMMDEDTPLFASLMEDPRFLEPARQLFGPEVLGIIVDANRYTGNTGWHPDTVSPLQYGVKFAFYLQPVGADTGALRVIPGTHRLFPFTEEFSEGVRSAGLREVPCQVLESQPGDVVAFDLRLWHASHGGSADRRMCTVVYYNNPKTPEEVEFLRRQGGDNVKIGLDAFRPRRDYLYSARWISNPNRNPDRQQWIDRLHEIGYFDAQRVIEAPPAA
ncbi:MAG: phytanoyl-CoA dioxygenase family protein [Verrucomicrobia bacterium]|nr:phytanoyl-CoA dioxygenase family protein [Verrucomicrobiota bacterium]